MFDTLGDISHFIYWSNAQYMLGRKSYRRSQYYYAPTTTLLHKAHGLYNSLYYRTSHDISDMTLRWSLAAAVHKSNVS